MPEHPSTARHKSCIGHETRPWLWWGCQGGDHVTARWIWGCPYPAVLQGDIEDVCRAAHEANPNAVEDHPLASVTDGLGQVLGSNCMDEGRKAAGHGLLWSAPGHHCSTKGEERR